MISLSIFLSIYLYIYLSIVIISVVVLAVFEEVRVDPGLYYLLFGEALLNDGVTFVMFEGLKSLGENAIIFRFH